MPERNAPEIWRLAILLAACGVAFLWGVPAISWLPTATAARDYISDLLGAQASVTALSLAVLLFVVQGVNARTDADEATYRAYLDRSHVRAGMAFSIAALALTAAMLLAVQETSSGLLLGPSAPNLLIAAALSFVANVLLMLFLFERTLRLLQPGGWRSLKDSVNEARIRRAVRSYLGRLRNRQPDDWLMFRYRQDQPEASANEAIAAIFEDAVRAVNDRRIGEFARLLDSLTALTEQAVTAIEAEGDVSWGVPGSTPTWPPVGEIQERLYSFLESCVRSNDREVAYQLRRFNHWMTSRGVRHECGELFTVGLNGYTWLYRVASRSGFREMHDYCVDSIWTSIRGSAVDAVRAQSADGRQTDEEALAHFPYMRHLVKQLETILDFAMHENRPDDFVHLQEGFESILRTLEYSWRGHDWPRPASAEHYDAILRAYRVALMGIGGRALALAESGTIAAAEPYLEPLRAILSDARTLAGDIAFALDEMHEDDFLWHNWETEGLKELVGGSIDPTRYPVSFFFMRMLEIAGAIPPLDLQGHARRLSEAFARERDRAARYANLQADDADALAATVQEVFDAAVKRDVVAEQAATIARPLSDARVSQFIADVYDSRFSFVDLERVFESAGASWYAHKSVAEPEERGFRGATARAPFVEAPGWVAINVHTIGPGLENDFMERFEIALSDAPRTDAPLSTTTEILQAIDREMLELNSEGPLVIVLAGDLIDQLVDLDVHRPAGYVPRWQARQQAPGYAEVALYREVPIVIYRVGGPRRVHVVDIGTWGCVVRAQVAGGMDMRVEILEITEAEARAALDRAGEAPSDERVRELQARVEMLVYERVGFHVKDATRARSTFDSVRATDHDETSAE